jgi:hypothetical protein
LCLISLNTMCVNNNTQIYDVKEKAFKGCVHFFCVYFLGKKIVHIIL